MELVTNEGMDYFSMNDFWKEQENENKKAEFWIPAGIMG